MLEKGRELDIREVIEDLAIGAGAAGEVFKLA